MNITRNLLTWVLAGAVLTPVARAEEPLNVIFYGNSFTLGFGSTRSVNAVFKDIAVAAGHPEPFVISAAASGQDFAFHVQSNLAPLFTTIPPANDWDYIVMQEHSTKLTRAYTGSIPFPQSVEASKNDAVALYEAAANRSAGVTPVLYETWARGPGHPFYQGSNPQFPGGPSEMQAEVRAGYNQLKGAIDASVGADLALIAPVGDAWENGNWDELHSPDLWHAQNRGTLLAALIIYGTVYNDLTVSDIDLSGVLASLNLGVADGVNLSRYADITLPEPTAALLLLIAAPFALRRR